MMAATIHEIASHRPTTDELIIIVVVSAVAAYWILRILFGRGRRK